MEDKGILLEKAEKHYYTDEDYAEKKIETYKNSTDFDLIDYKLSKKETKDKTYFVLTLKCRFSTLNEAKESM